MKIDFLKSRATVWLAIASSSNHVTLETLTTFKRRSNLSQSQKGSSNMTFLTKDLPNLGKDLDRALDSGRLLLTSPFKKRKDSELPLFLYELFIKFFMKNGVIREDADWSRLRLLRTLLFMFYKAVNDDFDISSATTKFINTDNSVRQNFCDSELLGLKTIIKFIELPDPIDIIGKHSNGQTACKYNAGERRSIVRTIPSLMKVFGLRYFSALPKHHILTHVTPVEPSSRVAFVPKDSRGPRTICMEPHERMFMQQGLMRSLYFHLQHTCSTAGYVNFTDQSINRRLAYSSSIDRAYATIDMRDASDLVSNELVQRVFPDSYKPVLKALRSETALLPDGTTLAFRKFAPMGSALCFPIEALLFYAICRTVSDEVYVYGDDIIVPAADYSAVCSRLHRYGLVVNLDKSFVNGYFRESCGEDYYKGYLISPIRYRRDDTVSVTEFINLTIDAFGSEYGDSVVRTLDYLGVVLPRISQVLREKGVVGVLCTNFHPAHFYRRRYNSDFQYYEIRVLKNRTVIKNPQYDDIFKYNDWLSNSFKGIDFSTYYKYERPNAIYNSARSIYEDQLFPVVSNATTDNFSSVEKTVCSYRWIEMVY